MNDLQLINFENEPPSSPHCYRRGLHLHLTTSKWTSIFNIWLENEPSSLPHGQNIKTSVFISWLENKPVFTLWLESMNHGFFLLMERGKMKLCSPPQGWKIILCFHFMVLTVYISLLEDNLWIYLAFRELPFIISVVLLLYDPNFNPM